MPPRDNPGWRLCFTICIKSARPLLCGHHISVNLLRNAGESCKQAEWHSNSSYITSHYLRLQLSDSLVATVLANNEHSDKARPLLQILTGSLCNKILVRMWILRFVVAASMQEIADKWEHSREYGKKLSGFANTKAPFRSIRTTCIKL